MAEIGVEMTKAVILGTIGKVMSAIEEEERLKERVQNDIEFMKAEFQMMQSFLGVADEERLKNSVVRTWVRQVRDLAYDVEDYFEVFVHHDIPKAWWWRLLPSCIAPPLPLDMAVAGIKRLRARVEDVSQRNLRYRLIGDSGSRPLAGDQAAGETFGILRGVEEAAWKKRDLRDLTKLITGEGSDLRQLQVISVWAAGGDLSLKTTSIIRKAFADPQICEAFPSRAWIKPMHPFNPEEFLGSLLTQFYANSPQHECGAKPMHTFNPQELLRSLLAGKGRGCGANLGVHVRMKMKVATDSEDGLMQKFVQRVHSQRYLIVIEDLSNMVEWDAIRMYLPDETNGSRIIVSTRQLGIARLCTGEPYQVSGLLDSPDDDSVCVFSNEGSSRLLSFDDMKNEANRFMESFKLVGRQREMRQLHRHINSATGVDAGTHPVTSVWGIAGVGKSALVKTLYYNQMLSDDSRFKQFSWVDVPHPFTLVEFSRRLHWYSRLQADMTAVVEHSHSLIVIDDLRSAEEWDIIQTSLSSRTRCAVIVITDDETVATHCCANEKQSQLANIKCLEADAAFDLFSEEIGETPYRWSSTYSVMAKCGGLPKVIHEVGLHTDLYDSLNDAFMRALGTKAAYANLRGLMAWMKFFFRTCPDSLKPYIYYMSVFPVGCDIRQRRLVRRWIAEGYSEDTDGRVAEENMDKIFSKLVDLSIIQRSAKDRLGRVNGFFREYMVSQPMEENLVFVLDGESSTSQHRERHLSIQKNWIPSMAYGTIDLSRLRSLSVFGKWPSHFIHSVMVLVQVLDLEDATDVTDDDLISVFNKVPRLKFLSLRGCIEIKRLPSSLYRLKHLQTLDVRGTSITKLPLAVIRLRNLQYFRAGCPLPLVASLPGADASLSSRPYNGGVVAPQGIWKLQALDTLGVVDVGAAGGKAVLKDLSSLINLRKLGVSGINRKNVGLFRKVVSMSKHNLESLSVRLEEDNEDYCGQLDTIRPRHKLQSLKLYGPIGKFPAEWIGQNRNLRKLALQMIMLAPADMEVISGLPKLHTLRLFVDQFQDDELSMSAAVVVLELVCKSNLHVTFRGRAIEKLEVLKVPGSSRPSMLFSGLENLESIREVWLMGSCEERLKQEWRDVRVRHPRKPALRVEESSS